MKLNTQLPSRKFLRSGLYQVQYEHLLARPAALSSSGRSSHRSMNGSLVFPSFMFSSILLFSIRSSVRLRMLFRGMFMAHLPA